LLLRHATTPTLPPPVPERELKRDVTAARWTFIIDRDGRIAYKDTQVDPSGDGEAVLAALRKLRGR
jgi:thioredoxin-dependent peroxiredoxin